METLYTAIVTTIGGRAGHTISSDGVIDYDLSLPKNLGGIEKPGTTNPEQLFAAGYSACFGSAIDLIAKKKHITLKEIDVTAEVSLNNSESGFGLAVHLKVYLPGISHAEAEQIVNDAHQVCPYSKATRGNIEVKLSVLDTK